MTIELVIVTGIITAAALYIARYCWQMFSGKRTTCGCGDSACPKQAPKH